MSTVLPERERWTEWLGVGRSIGVRERDLPADIAGVDAHLERTIREELRWTPASRHLRIVTGDLMPELLRTRLGLPFTRADRTLFRAHCAVALRLGPLQRGPLSELGLHYVRWRRAALARGEVAGGRVAERAALAA